MVSETERGLQEIFHEATMQYAQKALTKPSDWAEQSEIQNRHAQQREELQQQFLDTFDDRVKTERLRLINQAGTPVHDHPAPMGVDRFSNANITRVARDNVIQSHENDLLHVDKQELRKTQDLIDRAQTRDGRQGEATHAFNKVNDRRDGPDRRAPTRTR